MSKLNLNLLPNRAKFQAQRIHLRRIANKFLIFFVSGVVFLSLISFSVYYFFDFRRSRQEAKVKKLEAEVKTLSDRAITSWRLKYVAGMVAGALKNRFEYGQSFDLVNSFLPEGIVTDKLELREDNVFFVSGKTERKEVINEIEGKIKTINQGGMDDFSSGRLSFLSYSAGLWNYNLELKLK